MNSCSLTGHMPRQGESYIGLRQLQRVMKLCAAALSDHDSVEYSGNERQPEKQLCAHWTTLREHFESPRTRIFRIWRQKIAFVCSN